MQTYDGYLLYHKDAPFLYVADGNVDNVQQFIKDYCASQNTQMISSQWIVIPLRSIISRAIVKPDHHLQESHVPSRYKAVEGDIPVVVNRRCFD